jgi:hypothetical protein
MNTPKDTLPFIEYCLREDKSQYPLASNTIDSRTGKFFVDSDNDFLIGNSGGFLMNISFKFVNTKLLSPAANEYEKNKKDIGIVNWINGLDIPKTENRNKYYYCPYLSGTNEYNSFWAEETRRRKAGYTAKCKLLSNGEVVDLHITGDQYNYLNYGRILRTPTIDERAELDDVGNTKQKQIEAFPRFWDGDYWNFKIDSFIANNNYHLTKGKARGKGYSYKRGSQGANTINIIPNATVILAAYDLKYLTDPQATSDMVKTNLDWYENSTHWRRFYLSEGLDSIELGFKTKSGGNKKYGYRSKLLSVSLFGSESAAIGKRAIEIDFEESGKCPNLEEALDVTLSSTEVGAGNVGTIRVYGTAGTKDANWQPFSNVFFNPGRYKMMPFENVWDNNARFSVCGFFHPQVWNMEPYMDEDGNSLLELAYIKDKEDKKQRADKLTSDKYIIYVGQRANTPEEAFRRGGENLFTSIELSNHVSNILANRELQSYRDGQLVEENGEIEFRTNKYLIGKGLSGYAHPYIEEVPFNPQKDFKGALREYYPPYKVDGKIPDGLYAVTYDPVGKDKKADTVINKNSLASINVLMFPNNYPNIGSDILVASWAGRYESMEEMDRLFLKTIQRYNAKGVVEVDRGNTVANFRRWKKLYLLYKDPTVVLSNRQKESASIGYGVNTGSGNNAVDGLTYLRDWLYTKRSVTAEGKELYTFHYISDIPFLKELLLYNINGNFDRISSMVLYQFILKAMRIKRNSDIVVSGEKFNIHKAIGLYNYS